MSALRRDPDVSARIEQEISRLTMETIETKRSELTADLAASLEAEFASVKRERASKLDAELTDLETSSLQELQAKIDSQTSAALWAIEVRKAGLDDRSSPSRRDLKISRAIFGSGSPAPETRLATLSACESSVAAITALACCSPSSAASSPRTICSTY